LLKSTSSEECLLGLQRTAVAGSCIVAAKALKKHGVVA